MPSSDYSSVSRGALKIKGVQGPKVSKSGKKKKKSKEEPQAEKPPTDEQKTKSLADALADEDSLDPNAEAKFGEHMTETERQAYERRYKMLEDRLKKEGVKTHKERVENLNRYLSTLSEHHDMPKIGPG